MDLKIILPLIMVVGLSVGGVAFAVETYISTANISVNVIPEKVGIITPDAVGLGDIKIGGVTAPCAVSVENTLSRSLTLTISGKDNYVYYILTDVHGAAIPSATLAPNTSTIIYIKGVAHPNATLGYHNVPVVFQAS